MTSPASLKAKPVTFSVPTRLTPSESESLRADKKRLSERVKELLAQEKAAKAAAAAAPEASATGLLKPGAE
jgi:hypothetical protein